MNAIEIFDILTRRRVFVRVVNLQIDGVDDSGTPIYKPSIKVTIGKNGVELATFIGESFETEMNNGYNWAIENKIIMDAPVYLPQCEKCMRKIGGEILEICKDPENPNRHQNWHHTKANDYCLYSLDWGSYPESHWKLCLTSEQFALAKSYHCK